MEYSGVIGVGDMRLFFEKASSQSKNQKLVINAFLVLVILDIINIFLLDWYWFSAMSFCLYIVFIIIFVRGIMKKYYNK